MAIPLRFQGRNAPKFHREGVGILLAPPTNRNGNNGGSGHGGNNNQPPSPWLDPENEPNPSQQASFVEYLRWMRPADHHYKDATKVQTLQMATEKPDYNSRLKQLNKRTELIAGQANVFSVTCPWRIRVGGHSGPESILLPAFDASGIPYIPSSTLRGIARTQAIRQVMKERNLTWKKAEEDSLIVEHFGSLQAEAKNQAGKIVFLDVYPVAGKCHLEIDMANNIWNWKDGQLNYSPNPNPFLSLKETTFLMGLRLISGCENQQLLKQVKIWLIQGLSNGVGSQINTGYGQLLENPKKSLSESFLKVEFTIEGQLIHGYQKFKNAKEPYKKDRDGKLKTDRYGNFQSDGIAQTEVRPTAFKSMLRYWFRALATGVLDANQVQALEGKLFCTINPIASQGHLTVRILEDNITQKEARPSHQGKNDPCGSMTGILNLSFSQEMITEEAQKSLENLFKILTWLMFNLGGVGQGARRPCYSRKSRERAPWWRGSTVIIETENQFWDLPEETKSFALLVIKRLRAFYQELAIVTDIKFDLNNFRELGQVTSTQWQEAIDKNCRILIVAGEEKFGKPYALAQLHHEQLKKHNHRGELDYDGDLCGMTQGNRVKPSPVWIADIGDYQIVTIFGATADPRKEYIKQLKKNSEQCFQVFPLPQK